MFQNLCELQQKSCERFGSKRLFGVKRGGVWQWTSFREFAEDVANFRAGLHQLGIQKGDRVAVVSDNSQEWATAAYASYSLSAAFVPMYQSQLPDEWEYILRDSGARCVIGATPAVYEKLQELKTRCPALQVVLGVGLAEGHADSFQTVLQRGKASPYPAQPPAATDIAGLIYTSGTTGNPKGVVLTHKNLCANLHSMQQIFPLRDDTSLAFLPWTHCFGQVCELHNLMSLGCSLAINDDVKNLVSNLAEVKPTILVAVPRIFNRIYDGVNKQMTEKPAIIQRLFRAGIEAATLRTRGQQLGLMQQLTLSLADKLIFSKVRARFGGKLQQVISGSAALSKEVAEFVDALGITVYEGYGLTETSPVVSSNYAGNRKIGTIGKALPGVRVWIDESVSEEPGVGEIVVYGDLVMQGYYNAPEDTARVLTQDGGLRTGDLGRVDADGYISITGRIKEQYKLETGKYVVPAPLEEQLKLSPYIANVMLFGANRPHNVALVVADTARVQEWAKAGGKTLSDMESDPQVKALLKAELERLSAGFKSYERPRAIKIICEDFTQENGLLTPSFKVKRGKVLELYGETLTSLY